MKEINTRSEEMLFRVKESLNQKIDLNSKLSKTGLEDMRQMMVKQGYTYATKYELTKMQKKVESFTNIDHINKL